MVTKTALEILRRAALGTLPRTIDDQTKGIDMAAFRELHQAGLMDAIDASADRGNCYLEPAITLRGREALQRDVDAARPWWAAFDRRMAVIGVIAAVLSLAATVGVLKGQ